MASNYNPVTSGLMQAFQLAQMVTRAKQERELLALAKQREERAGQYDKWRMEQSKLEEERQTADLMTRLNTIGARKATPSDDLEAELGQRVTSKQYPGMEKAGFLPALEPTDVAQRTVKIRGEKWIMPGEAEREERLDRAGARQTRRVVAQTKAQGEAKTQTAIAGKKAEMEALGVAISDENAELLGMAKGTRILPEHMDDYQRALATAIVRKKEADGKAISRAFQFQTEKGTYVATLFKDGLLELTEMKDAAGVPVGGRGSRSTASNTAAMKFAEEQVIDGLAGDLLSRANNDPAGALALLKDETKTNPTLRRYNFKLTAALRKMDPGLTPGQQATQERADRARRDKLIEKRDAKKSRLQTLQKGLKDGWTQDPRGRTLKFTSDNHKTMRPAAEAEIDKLKREIAELNQQIGAAPKAAAPAHSAPAAAPGNPYRPGGIVPENPYRKKKAA